MCAWIKIQFYYSMDSGIWSWDKLQVVTRSGVSDCRAHEDLIDLRELQLPNWEGTAQTWDHGVIWCRRLRSTLKPWRGFRKLISGQPTGRRPVGRPKYSWVVVVLKDLRELQLSNWEEIAQSWDNGVICCRRPYIGLRQQIYGV